MPTEKEEEKSAMLYASRTKNRQGEGKKCISSGHKHPKKEENLLPELVHAVSHIGRKGEGDGYHQNAKHLRNQPPVPGYPGPVLHEFPLGAFDVLDHVFGVGVDSLDHFAAGCL